MSKLINIQLIGIYDGVCVKFNTETKEFIWREIAIERSTERQRKRFETKFLKQYEKSN